MVEQVIAHLHLAPVFGIRISESIWGSSLLRQLPYVDQSSVLDESNGNIYKPYHTIAAGAQQAADHDILNIARGTYNESVTINKPLTLSAPVGAVVIGAAGGANS